MPEDKMFAQLMNERPARGVRQRPARPEETRIRHMTVNLPERQAAIVDRYFVLFYDSDFRPTRGQIVATALEVLDRLLAGRTPQRLDSSVLDDYVSTHAGMQAPAHAGRQARRLAADEDNNTGGEDEHG